MPERHDSAERIVVFGAGNIGRSFVGQIFSRAGFNVVFVDLDQELVAALNKNHCYTVIHRDPSGGEEALEIGPVSAVDGRDHTNVADVLVGTRYVATSVGAAALPKVLPILAKEMERRIREERVSATAMDIILAENIHGAGAIVRDTVPGAGAVECSVGKMVPIIPVELREKDILTVYAEPYNTLIVDRDSWKNPIPPVPELFPVSPISAWIDRKLYIHNLGHAACAYLASATREDIRFIWQATADNEIMTRTRNAMAITAEGLVREYPDVFTSEQLDEHIADLLYRFSSKSLGDTVYRVGRDLRRKLGPADRIVGALRLLQRHHCDTTPLEEVYQAALSFRSRDEQGNEFPPDREFLDQLNAAKTAEKWLLLAEVSGFDIRSDEDRRLLERLVS